MQKPQKLFGQPNIFGGVNLQYLLSSTQTG